MKGGVIPIRTTPQDSNLLPLLRTQTPSLPLGQIVELAQTMGCPLEGRPLLTQTRHRKGTLASKSLP